MATTTQVFTGTTATTVVTVTNIFPLDSTGIYLVYTGASGLDYVVDAYLQIYVAPGVQRNFPFILENDNLSTIGILAIPQQFLGFPMTLNMFWSEVIPIEVWVTNGDCSCATQLSDLQTKVNILVADAIFTTVTSLIGLVVSGGVTALLPALLPGAVRGVINILNPAAETILIGLDKVPTAGNYDFLVPAGNDFQIPAGFTGAVNAITQSGNPASVNVTTFP